MARRGRKGGKEAVSGIIWLAALAVLLAGVTGGYMYLKRSQAVHVTDADTGCLSASTTPEADLFMVDATDHLSAATANEVVQAIRDRVKELPRYSQVIIVAFGDDTSTPLAPLFSHCLPGQAKDARLDESGRFLDDAYVGFEKALLDMSTKLQNLPDAPTSPITAQITRAASNPVLHWTGDKRTLVLFSDGLESSIYWTKNLKLREPAPHILDGVSAEYFELGNARAKRLQTEDMREEWKRWFDKAGASVRMTAPGYAAS
ncbi:hypothetical protein ASE00_05195 [Sphingomonas sp. Root710]|uniref:hypothetical protein n=1 Tax=Sphingomonas sp. Root710 TaxID=1736594 RepID=UPI0006F417DB|nr:hypothetical protein [Sphingomonas sp. Root710]KRB86134.1 hypothetical protein ASE00_05195 [Sphingomonas sp. Root710]